MKIIWPGGRRDQRPMISLSARERDILAILAVGRNNSEIAVALSIAPATVRNCLHRMCAATGLNRVQLAVWAATNPSVLAGAAVDTELRLPAD